MSSNLFSPFALGKLNAQLQSRIFLGVRAGASGEVLVRHFLFRHDVQIIEAGKAQYAGNAFPACAVKR